MGGGGVSDINVLKRTNLYKFKKINDEQIIFVSFTFLHHIFIFFK